MPTTSSDCACGQRHCHDAVGTGLAAADNLLIDEHLHVAARVRFAAVPVGGKHQHLTWRRLGDQPDVGHHHDGVGAQQILTRPRRDRRPARVIVEWHAPVLRIAQIGQQLAPGRDQLVGIEQRHLRERRLD